MLSASIQRLHTKFQPNWLQKVKIMQVLHFLASRLVEWQASFAGQHTQMHIYQLHMLSPSIQRLHIKFQPNWLKNAKVTHVFHFQAGWAGWGGRITKIGEDIKRLTLVQLPFKYQANQSKHKKASKLQSPTGNCNF